MAKEKIKKEAISPEGEIPKVDLKPTVASTETAKQRQEKWDAIESELSAVRQDYTSGKMTFEALIDKLVAALTALKTAQEPGLTGLGEKPEMQFNAAGEGEETQPLT